MSKAACIGIAVVLSVAAVAIIKATDPFKLNTSVLKL